MPNLGVARGIGLTPFIPPPIVSQAGGLGVTDGFVPQMDSTQPGVLGLGTRAYNLNNQSLVNAGAVLIGETGYVSGTIAKLEVTDATTYSTTANLLYYGLHLLGTTTFTTNAPVVLSSLQLENTFTLSVAASKAKVQGIVATPTLAGANAPASYFGIRSLPIYTATTTLSSLYGIQSIPTVNNASATVTTVYGLQVGATLTAGTITTVVGLDVGVSTALAGSTIWGIQVGNYQSYFNGKTTFGGTGSPTWDIHVQGGNAATNGIGIDISTTAPTAPSSNASAVISVYKGSPNTYLLVTFNDNGTTRYRYMELDGTAATWTEGTSLPT